MGAWTMTPYRWSVIRQIARPVCLVFVGESQSKESGGQHTAPQSRAAGARGPSPHSRTVSRAAVAHGDLDGRKHQRDSRCRERLSLTPPHCLISTCPRQRRPSKRTSVSRVPVPDDSPARKTDSCHRRDERSAPHPDGRSQSHSRLLSERPSPAP